MSDDAPKMTLVERTREIAKTVGLLQAETIKLRNAGLPPKFLGSLAAVEKALNVLADQNAAPKRRPRRTSLRRRPRSPPPRPICR
jgi:hypothetical protein